MNLGIAINLAATSAPRWSPASLFVSGDVGLWYDPSDLTTQFQDHTGTTPVTADGQSVGLVLDKGPWGGMSTAQMLTLYATSDPLALPGRHLIQPVEASKPKYKTAGGLHWWLLDGVNDGWYTSASFAWASDKAAFAGGLYRGTAAEALQVFAEFSPSAPLNVGGWLVVEDVSNAVPWGTYAKGTAAVSLSQLSKITGPINTFESIVGNMDIAGDLSRIWKNGVQGIDGTGDKGAGNFGTFQFYVGRRNNANSPANCRISDIFARNRLWTNEERGNIDRYITRRAGISTPMIVGDGASGMTGYGSSDPATQNPIAQLNLPGWAKLNLAVNGATTPQRAASASNPTIYYNPLRSKNVAVLWEASNHISSGASDATVQSAYRSWCEFVRAPGAEVIAVSVLPKAGDAGFEAKRQTFNVWLRANWQEFSDGFADIAADPRIGDAGDQNDTTYYPDGQHMNAAGYGIVASIIAAAIGPFDPVALLFGAGEQGGLWPFTPGTVWKDTARTVPCTAPDDLIACADDISGHGKHLFQSVESKRFKWQTDGTYYWALADGLDDFMATSGALNMSSSDKMAILAGVRKMGAVDATAGLIAELGPNASTTNGTAWLAAPTAPNLDDAGAFSRGASAGVIARSTADSALPPVSLVLSAELDTTAGVTFRQNGAAFTNATSGGGGNYASAQTLYVGGRAGTSLFFNGRIYPLIMRAGAISAGLRAQTEAWINARTGAY